MQFVVPPGGFAGFSQMTPASKRALFSNGGSRGGGMRRKRRTKKKAKRAARRAGGGSRKMKFGSPAWQRKYRVGRFAKKKK